MQYYKNQNVFRRLIVNCFAAQGKIIKYTKILET
jgi:hypothetical protein